MAAYENDARFEALLVAHVKEEHRDLARKALLFFSPKLRGDQMPSFDTARLALLGQTSSLSEYTATHPDGMPSFEAVLIEQHAPTFALGPLQTFTAGGVVSFHHQGELLVGRVLSNGAPAKPTTIFIGADGVAQCPQKQNHLLTPLDSDDPLSLTLADMPTMLAARPQRTTASGKQSRSHTKDVSTSSGGKGKRQCL
jgi:hypothetical protein